MHGIENQVLVWTRCYLSDWLQGANVKGILSNRRSYVMVFNRDLFSGLFCAICTLNLCLISSLNALVYGNIHMLMIHNFIFQLERKIMFLIYYIKSDTLSVCVNAITEVCFHDLRNIARICRRLSEECKIIV